MGQCCNGKLFPNITKDWWQLLCHLGSAGKRGIHFGVKYLTRPQIHEVEGTR